MLGSKELVDHASNQSSTAFQPCIIVILYHFFHYLPKMPKHGNSVQPQNFYKKLKISFKNVVSICFVRVHNGFLILYYSHFISFFHYLPEMPKCGNSVSDPDIFENMFFKNIMVGDGISIFENFG